MPMEMVRSLPKSTFMGPYSYSLDKYLETLSLPHNALIGVMINASEFLNEYSKTDSIIDNLFHLQKTHLLIWFV